MKRAAITACLIAAGGLGLSACYGGNQSGPKVAVNGDSITTLSDAAIENTLGVDYAWEIDATGGYTFQDGVEGLEDQYNNPSGPPNDVIINLGTNDVFQYPTNGEGWRIGFNQMVDVAGFGGACTIWVTVSTYADDILAGSSAAGVPVAEEINSANEALPAQDPNFHVLDWNAFITSGNNFDTYITPLDSFGLNVHPNAAGQQVLANMYEQALQQDCPS